MINCSQHFKVILEVLNYPATIGSNDGKEKCRMKPKVSLKEEQWIRQYCQVWILEEAVLFDSITSHRASNRSKRQMQKTPRKPKAS